MPYSASDKVRQKTVGAAKEAIYTRGVLEIRGKVP